MDNEFEIKSSKEELLDTIHNLMGLVDTPIGRRLIKGIVADDIRCEARKIMQANNRSVLAGNIPDGHSYCMECRSPMGMEQHNYGTEDHLCCIQCYNDAQLNPNLNDNDA